MYLENKLPKLCSKLIFKHLLLKLTTPKTFMLNKKCYRQVDECALDGQLSLIFSDIFITETEKKVFKQPTKLQFYKIFVHDNQFFFCNFYFIFYKLC